MMTQILEIGVGFILWCLASIVICRGSNAINVINASEETPDRSVAVAWGVLLLVVLSLVSWAIGHAVLEGWR